MPIGVKVSLQGILAAGQADAWANRVRANVTKAFVEGMREARPQTDAIMRDETKRSFKVVPGSKLERSWRGKVEDAGTANPKLVITNLAKWFAIHTEGGVIGRRSTPRAILIPINTRLGTRISTKKFYRMVAWLMQAGLTVIKDGRLYVKPPMNTSRRGGVAVGSRVSKKFRAQFQGSAKRPSGFDIKLNAEGLTPIAIIRTRIAMPKRMNLNGITQEKLLPVESREIMKRMGEAGAAR